MLLDLVRRVYPDCPAVFVDTGLEYPEIREFVKSMPNVTWLKPKKNFKQVILEYGYPLIAKEIAMKIHYKKRGAAWADKYFDKEYWIERYGAKGSRYYVADKWHKLLDADFDVNNRCCQVMKKSPMHTFERQSGKHPIMGLLATESARRKTQWLKYGCNIFDTKNPASRPLSFWTEQDILEYIKRFNLPYASVYGDIIEDEKGHLSLTGVERTGCIFCGFGAQCEKFPNRFQRLKQTHPKIWEYCMKPVEDGGLGMKHVLEYIDVPIE